MRPFFAVSTNAAHPMKESNDAREVLGIDVVIVPTKHGRGWLGWVLGPVSGVYLSHPDEPSSLLTSDAVLTPSLLEAIARPQPEVIVTPAGAANMGVGGDILFSLDELVTLVRRTQLCVSLASQ